MLNVLLKRRPTIAMRNFRGSMPSQIADRLNAGCIWKSNKRISVRYRDAIIVEFWMYVSLWNCCGVNFRLFSSSKLTSIIMLRKNMDVTHTCIWRSWHQDMTSGDYNSLVKTMQTVAFPCLSFQLLALLLLICLGAIQNIFSQRRRARCRLVLMFVRVSTFPTNQHNSAWYHPHQL